MMPSHRDEAKFRFPKNRKHTAPDTPSLGPHAQSRPKVPRGRLQDESS